jgi:hypothetical protein
MPDLTRFQQAFAFGVTGPGSPIRPMAIYRNTALLGAVEALRDNFPVCRAIVGERAFEALAAAFARRMPPDTPVLAHYGSRFPRWLESQAAAQSLPYLADVARCELMWVEALHAEDAPALDIASAQAIAPEALPGHRLKLHPGARFAWQPTPAIEIWLAHQGELADEIAPEWRACGALFSRPGITVEAAALDASAHRLLCGIRLGETLGEAAGAAGALYPGADIGSCFAGLVQRGCFAALSRER